ncbi:glycosyltransferase, partial [uncultured Nitratireductor sp.]|uniref:glycosyltransferase n=1 Tax=uncultured Nitratireductor sp. TaxID=520953 RepID=UPI0025DD6AB3
MSKEKLLPVNMLWVGESVGLNEQLSMLSFLACGHPVLLHVYDTVTNAPNGVRLVDATRTVEFERIQSLRERKTGSFALASDYFRYMLQARNAGLWADMDMVCLKPVRKRKQTIMGFERPDSINCAILQLDKDLPIVGELLGIFRDGYIPPWVDPKVARKRRLKRWLPNRRIRPAIMPWGTYGPQALTSLARKHALIDQAEPKPVFYPLDQFRA